MTNATYDEIFEAAVSLPPGLRAMLAEHPIKSLDAVNQAEIDALWGEEVEKRIKSIEEGVVVPIDGKQVLRQLRSQ